ncbi:MAG: TrkH family potassium uptake protein [Corallococcus sp.]|nr:TrkH family potassium uptake protein [Corallococcus sp.]MCM1358938.1 TrkH family potassium uptake protein [Corallococcus sp.]MCM1394926.1 TrkH family potassium uptake protein [Corallococcus sp.]
MNFRVIFQTLGKVSFMLGVLLLVPAVLSACLAESCWWALLTTAGIAVAVGLPLVLFCKPKNNVIFSKEGLIIVSLSWIWVSLVGALPFVISGAIPNYIDAFFETASGFSTTGATILKGEQIESMAKGLLFWRSFTHWIGGMGVIVFVMAIAGGAADRSMHVLRAEMPGPTVDKIVPRARDTAKILYLLYVVFTFVEIVALIIAGMPLFDSVVHAFGTAGTGGFGIKADSIASYNAACQWIITVFMILFGVNFNLYYLLLMRKFKSAFSSRELWIYGGIIVCSSLIIGFNVSNRFGYTSSAGDTVRQSVFQVAAFLTTTGYSTIPASSSINAWPMLSKGLLFLLMFIGGCAGSTGGGLKVSRVAILCCAIKKELRKVVHPRNANAVKFEKKTLSDETLHGVVSYFGLYVLIMLATFLVLCCDTGAGLTVETNITAAVSCLNNIGPAYGSAAAGYYVFSPFSKLILSVVMLLGRLEIYPILLTLTPTTWIKK